MKKIKTFFSTLTLNIWFYFWAPIVLIASLSIYIPILFFTRIFLPQKTMHLFRKFINFYGKSVAYTAYPWIKIKIYNLPEKNNAPYIFTVNHTSSFDAFMQGFLPFELVQAARGWALNLPILGIIARGAGYLDVDKLAPNNFIDEAIKRINAGISIVFFPEGTRHPLEKLGPFHSTAFRVAYDSKTSIVPVIIVGIENKPKKGSLIMHSGNIKIYCLPTIPHEEYKNLSVQGLKKRIRKEMETFIKEKLINKKNNL